MKDSISLELSLNVFLLLIYYEIGGNRTPRMCFIRESWHLDLYMISEPLHLLF